MPTREEYWRDPEKHRAKMRAYALAHPEWKRERDREWMAKDRAANPGKALSERQRYRDRDPQRYLVQHAKHRAKRAGVPFSLTAKDVEIPEFCPVLGIRLAWGMGKRASANRASPSLDRIVGELGYVAGNVRVISNRANHIKNNATAAELQAIATYTKEETNRVLCDLRDLNFAG